MPLGLMNWKNEKAWCVCQCENSVPGSGSSTACQGATSGTPRWSPGLGTALLCDSDQGESWTTSQAGAQPAEEPESPMRPPDLIRDVPPWLQALSGVISVADALIVCLSQEALSGNNS